MLIKCSFILVQIALLVRDYLRYYLFSYIAFPHLVNPLSANPTEWSNTLKTIRRLLPTNCLSVFDHFVGLALKG